MGSIVYNMTEFIEWLGRRLTVFIRCSSATLSWFSNVSCSLSSLRKSWKPSSESLQASSGAAILLVKRLGCKSNFSTSISCSKLLEFS